MDLRGDVVVVGGGASGALVVAALLRSAAPMRILWIERSGHFGRGIAYSTREAAHLLNVPAGKMGADPGDVGGFLRWVQTRGLNAERNQFLSRGLYGDYLEHHLAQLERAHPESQLLRVRGEAVDALQTGQDVRLPLRSGDALLARTVVLATGNLQPASLHCEPGAESRVRSAWGFTMCAAGLSAWSRRGTSVK